MGLNLSLFVFAYLFILNGPYWVSLVLLHYVLFGCFHSQKHHKYKIRFASRLFLEENNFCSIQMCHSIKNSANFYPQLLCNVKPYSCAKSLAHKIITNVCISIRTQCTFHCQCLENITSFKSTTQEVTIPGGCKQEA